jgi:hypothetical protein
MSLYSGGCGEDDVESEAGHEGDEALGHGEGLGVGGSEGPADADLLAAEVLAEELAHGHEVGEGLRGVVDVALHVDDGDVGGGGDFAHIRIAGAGDEVVADGDAVAHAAEDDAGIAWAVSPWEICVALESRKWAWAPSCVAPASNALRVRVLLSKKRRKTVCQGRRLVGSPRLKRALSSSAKSRR